jgi:hypothetical protein
MKRDMDLCRESPSRRPIAASISDSTRAGSESGCGKKKGGPKAALFRGNHFGHRGLHVVIVEQPVSLPRSPMPLEAQPNHHRGEDRPGCP